MKKKIVSFVLITALLGVFLGMGLPIRNVWASDGDFTIENGVLKKYTGSDSDVAIPEGVTQIGAEAFKGCRSLMSVTIPDGVTSIGNSAFSGCSGLNSVTIPDGVTSIGNSTFSGCYALTSMTIPDGVTSIGNSTFSGCYALTSVTIPDGVTSIGNYAFSRCSALTGVTIPSGVASIGKYAFSACTALTSVTIPGSVETIDEKVFSECTSLKDVVIGRGVEHIGNSAFYRCTSLTGITIPDSVVSLGDSTFSGCTSLTRITLPSSVYYIGECTFYDCTSLTAIEAPSMSKDGVLFVAEYQTLDCYPAGRTDAEYSIPSTTGIIHKNSFYNCQSLQSVTIPSSVYSVGEKAFVNCNALTTVTILAKSVNATAYSFKNCPIATVNYVGSQSDWNNSSWSKTSLNNAATFNFNYCPGFEYQDGVLNRYTGAGGDVVIPDVITSIGASAFAGCTTLHTVTIPSSVTSIGDSAFAGCTALHTVTIPNSVTSIGDSAFAGCTTLDSVTIPNSVTSVGVFAFSDCTALKTVSIMAISASVADSAFNGTAVETVSYAGNENQWNASNWKETALKDAAKIDYFFSPNFKVENGVLIKYLGSNSSVTIPNNITAIGDRAFSEITSLKSVRIPNGVTSIGKYAFSGCYYLSSVTIPDSMTTIDDGAFSNCKMLESIHIPDSVTSIGASAFYQCYRLKSVEIPSSVRSIGLGAFSLCQSLTDVTIHKGLTSIGEMAFSQCSALKSMTLPDSVTSIGADAFYCCFALTSIDIPDSVTSIGREAFRASALKSVVIPNGVTSIEPSTFSGCQSLTDITIPLSVTSIGASAFEDCTSLTSVTIPSSVQSFAFDPSSGGVFDGCTNLTTINVAENSAYFCDVDGVLYSKNKSALVCYPAGKTDTGYSIPDSVKTIEVSAFYYNKSLQSVVIPASVRSIGAFSFSYCTSLKDMTLPCGVSEIGKSAFYKCTSLTSVTVPGTVSTISSYAFLSCSSLTSLTISDGVETVCTGAFNQCSYLKTVNILAKSPTIETSVFYSAPVETVNYRGTESEWNASGWKDVLNPTTVNYNYNPDFTIEDGVLTKYTGTGVTADIPSGVTSIGAKVFLGCYWLREIHITQGVTSIGDEAFSQCGSLQSITIPSGVTSIGQNAFSYDESLTKIDIPASVTNIGKCSFDHCPSLTAVNVNSGNADYCSVNGVLYNKNKTTLICYPPANTGISFTVPDTVETIEDYAFFHCGSLKTVSLPDSVTHIGNFAFYDCNHLSAITIPSGVTHVGVNAFSDCTALKTITIFAKGANVDVSSFTQVKPDVVNFDGTEDEWNESKWKIALDSPASVIYNYGTLAITQQPLSTGIVLGKSLTLSLTAQGIDLQYQWYYKKFGQTSFSPWNGHTRASETATPNATWDGIQLYCIVKDSAGNTVQSDTVTISVLSITTQPQSVTVAEGKNATFTVKATGAGLKYQWQYKKKGQTAWSNWNGRTTASTTATANATWGGMQVRCIVTDGVGNSLASNASVITITAPVTVTEQPKNQSIVLGKSVTLSVKATGDSLQYQWYFKKAGQTSFSVWNGRTHTSETVSPNATWDGIQLYCQITDGAGKTVNSDTVTISVLSIATQPQDVTVAAGKNATFTVKATGSGLKYQWQYKKKGATAWSNWNGRTTASTTATANTTWDGMQVRCIVTDSSGNTVNSNAATITIAASIAITAQPTGKAIKLGDSITLSLTATGNSLTYQWYFKKAGQTSFSVWNGRTHASETVAPNATWDGIQLYCVVKDSAGNTKQSDTITVNVLSIATQPQDVTVAAGKNASFTVKATGAGLQYQWQYKKKGATAWSNWNGRTTASTTATSNATWDGMQVRCVVTDSAGNTVNSNPATITIQ